MNTKSPTQSTLQILTQAEQIKVLADPTRLAILGQIRHEPCSGAQIARAIDLPPTRIHYHLRQLLDAGLIHSTGVGRKRWKEERFYLASALHYLIDPVVGTSDDAAARRLRQQAERFFVDWHRTHTLGVDLAQIARRVVHQCLLVQPGQRVEVLFGPQGQDLGESIIIELEASGAIARPRIWSKHTIVQLLERHDDASLAALDLMPASELDGLDAVAFVSSNMPEGDPLSPAQLARVHHLLAATSRWQRTLRDRRVPYLEIPLPNPREFFLGERALGAYWRSLCADPADLHSLGAPIASAVQPGSPIRFTCPLGTDLTLTAQRVFLSDGRIDADDIAAGATFESLPAGWVGIVPERGSASGRLVAPSTFVHGCHHHAIDATIDRGRICAIHTEDGSGDLARAIDHAKGDANELAAIRIGLNPGSTQLTGKAALDVCQRMIVSASFGNNELLGGQVRSTIDFHLPTPDATLCVGQRTLVRDGQPELESTP